MNKVYRWEILSITKKSAQSNVVVARNILEALALISEDVDILKVVYVKKMLGDVNEPLDNR